MKFIVIRKNSVYKSKEDIPLKKYFNVDYLHCTYEKKTETSGFGF